MSQNQPKGMLYISIAEAFERLGYYSLLFLLVIYTSGSLSDGGLGWTNAHALSLIGFYSLASYTLPLIGSYLADKYIGTYKAALLGGAIIFVGYCLLTFSGLHNVVFLISLGFIAAGTAFFKPAMPALLGTLYLQKDVRREPGFSWYYAGINLGGMIAGISSGMLTKHFGYPVAFFSSAASIFIGTMILLANKKSILAGHHHDGYVEPKDHNSNETDCPVADIPLTPKRKKAIRALFVVFIFFFIWGTIFNIAMNGTITLYIEKFTDRIVMGYTIPTTFFLSLESIAILAFTPIFTCVLAALKNRNKYPHFFSQMGLALWVAAIAIGYLTFLGYRGSHVSPGMKPFYSFEIMLFIIIIAISEVMISPVMMSAISVIAPEKSKTFFQSLYLALMGTSALLASKIGQFSLSNDFLTFLCVAAVTLVACVLFMFIKRSLINIALEAAEEQDELELLAEKSAVSA